MKHVLQATLFLFIFFGAQIFAQQPTLVGFMANYNIYKASHFFGYRINENKATTSAVYPKLAAIPKNTSPIEASNGKIYGVTTEGGNYNLGVLFESDKITGVTQTKVHFSEQSGYAPSGNLTLATDGKIYGITTAGGSFGKGSIFQYDISSTNLTKLYDLQFYMCSNLIQATNGLFYGTSSTGIFKFDSNTKILTSVYTATSTLSTGSLMQAPDGKLYGTFNTGGTLNAGVIFQFDVNTNTYAEKVAFTVTNGSNPLSAMVKGSDGKLYGVTNTGGINNNGVLYKYDYITNLYTKLYDFTSTTGSSPTCSLVEWSNGLFYGLVPMTNNMGGVFEFNTITSTYTFKKSISSTVTGSLYKSSNNMLYCFAKNGPFQFNTSNSYLDGAMLKYDPSSNAVNVAASFGLVNGYSLAEVGLPLSDGTLLTTNYQGGVNDIGTIINIDYTNTIINKKVDFTDSIGKYPHHLVKASNGKFYGLASGGTANKGVIFKYDLSTNSLTKVYDFANDVNLATLPSCLIASSDGKLYGYTTTGGNYNKGIIFQFDPTTNTLTKKYAFHTANERFSQDIVQANNGKIYSMAYGSTVTTGYGGMYQFDINSGAYTMVLDFQTAQLGANPNQITLGIDGNIYCHINSSTTYKVLCYNPTTNITTAAITDFASNLPSGYVVYGISPITQASNSKFYFLLTTDSASNQVSSSGYLFFKSYVVEYDKLANTTTRKLCLDTLSKGIASAYRLVEINPCLSAMSTPVVSLTTPGTNICIGSPAEFTATVVNGGVAPIYTFKKNGVIVQSGTSNKYKGNSFSNNDVVVCLVSASNGCTSVTGTSNAITLTVNTTGNVSITGSNTICSGSAYYYTSSIANGNLWSTGGTTNQILVNSNQSIYVTAKTSSGCYATSATKTVTILPVPTVTYSLSTPSNIVCPNTSVAITASGASSYYISASVIGISGNTVIPNGGSFIPTTNTSIYVQGLASNGCYGYATGFVDVQTSPATPGVITGPTAICSLTSGSYSIAALNGATSYTWTLPSGLTGTSTTNSIATTINASGFTTGSISVVANNLCGSSAAKTLALSKVPATPGTISGAANTCGATSSLYQVLNVTGASSYTWTLPAGMTGTSTLNYISVAINSNVFTNGNITVTANNACGSSVAKSLAVSKTLATPAGISGPVSICGLTSATYSITAIAGAVSYVWTLPNGVTGTSTTNSINVAINNAVFTTGSISVYATNACGSGLSKSLTLVKIPAMPTSITGPTTGVCYTSSQSYTCATAAGATTYTWSVPTGAVITLGQGTKTISVTFPSQFVSGNVSVVASTACGSSAAKTVLVKAAPAAPTAVTGRNSNICNTPTVWYTYSCTPPAGITGLAWKYPAGCIKSNNTSSNPTNYYLTITYPSNFVSGTISVAAINACGDTGTYVNYAVKAAPTTSTSISSTSTTYCANQTGVVFTTAPINGTTNFTWTVPTGSSIVSGNGTASITVNLGNTAGNVSVKAVNGCASGNVVNKAIAFSCRESNDEAEEVTTDIANLSTEESQLIGIYPNPSHGEFIMNFEVEDDALYEIEIFDVTGRVVFDESLTIENKNAQLPISLQAKGMFFVQIRSGESTFTKKIIVE